MESSEPPVTKRRRRNRWGNGGGGGEPEASVTVSPPAATVPGDALARARALQSSVASRLAALRAASSGAPPPPKRARVFDVDDVSSDVTAVASVAANAAVGIKRREKEKEAKKAAEAEKRKRAEEAEREARRETNPYLSHVTEEEVRRDREETEGLAAPLPVLDVLDGRLPGADGPRRRGRRELKFADPGAFIEKAERKRAKAALAA